MIGSLDYSFAKIKALSKKLIDTFESQGIANNATNQYKRELERELNRYKTSDAYKII